jgi:uncharacterized protein YigA (DUF484 family)
MITRAVAAMMLVVAVAVRLGLERPAARRLEAARADLAEAHARNERLQARLMELDHRAALRAAAVGAAEGPGAASALRRSLLKATSGLAVSGVRVSVSGAEPPYAARGRLVAEGRFRDVLSLLQRLGAAGSGLALERATLARTPSGSRLEASGFTLRSEP